MHFNSDYDDIINSIMELHSLIRKTVRDNIKGGMKDLNTIVAEGNGDVTYRIDINSEKIIDSWFSRNAPAGGAVVLCEGLGKRVYPSEMDEQEVKWFILIDPLDGTRHIMYDNRSCWILTGVAENHGTQPKLYDIQAAVQTEVPTSLQEKGIVMAAVRNKGVHADIVDLNNDSIIGPYPMATSTALTLENGFAIFSNFFPGTKEIICTIEENVLKELYGEPKKNGALIFSEQYISNAGQLFMLTAGKYRMVADIRATLENYQASRGKNLPLCTHPYDLSASLIAEEAGCVLVNINGERLDYPMDLETNCTWICYANESLKSSIHPILINEMKNLGLLSEIKL